jgi:hypothetical protein
MRKHNGMRPQDVAILLKIVSMNTLSWQIADLGNLLKLSNSEISESLNRSRLAGLIDYNKKRVNRLNLLEFLEHGVKYVFPINPGTLIRGIPTAHSHPEMKKLFISEINYVWPYPNGEIIGLEIEPFYKKQVEAIYADKEFYKLLALVDSIRIGKAREVNFAIKELRKSILNEPPN